MADTGICCLDELRKLTAEHACLLESMEQGSISIAKAGMVATLSAKTTIIAAPILVGGSYTHHKTLQEKLNIPDALLSRFDLIFVSLDNTEINDDMIANHVIAMHTSQHRFIHDETETSSQPACC